MQICVQLRAGTAQRGHARPRAARPVAVPFAALSGIGLMVGALGGSIVGSMFFDSIAAGYVIFALFSLVTLSLFVLFNPDYSSKDLEPEPFKFVDFLRTFWVNPIKHPDFFWAFTGRLLLYTGYFAVTGYQLFILTDYLGVENPEHGDPAARPAQPRRHPDLDHHLRTPLRQGRPPQALHLRLVGVRRPRDAHPDRSRRPSRRGCS